MFNSAREITRLQEDLKNLRVERDNYQAEAARLKNETVAENAVLKGQLEEAKARIKHLEGVGGNVATLEQEKAALAAEVASLKGDFTTKVEAKVQELVIERCASAGVEPIQRSNQADTEAGADGTMSRKDFEALSPGAARQFIRQGGRVTR